jgi:hypothetical protein
MRKQFKNHLDSISISEEYHVLILEYLVKTICQLHDNYRESNDWIWDDSIEPKTKGIRYKLLVTKYYNDIVKLYQEHNTLNDNLFAIQIENYSNSNKPTTKIQNQQVLNKNKENPNEKFELEKMRLDFYENMKADFDDEKEREDEKREFEEIKSMFEVIKYELEQEEEMERGKIEFDRMLRKSGSFCSSCESSPCQCSDPERTSSY